MVAEKKIIFIFIGTFNRTYQVIFGQLMDVCGEPKGLKKIKTSLIIFLTILIKTSVS